MKQVIRLLGALTLGCTACMTAAESDDSPLPTENTIVDQTAAEIDQLVEQIQQTGPTTRSEHANLKRSLRSRGTTLTRAAGARYEAAKNDPDPLHRWTLLAALGQLRAPELTALYDEVASEPLPAGDAEVGHGAFGKNDMEMMIRMRAIAALRDLASERHPAALSALFDNVRLPNRQLRFFATQAMLTAGNRSAGVQRALKEALSSDDQWMAEVKPHTIKRTSATSTPAAQTTGGAQ